MQIAKQKRILITGCVFSMDLAVQCGYRTQQTEFISLVPGLLLFIVTPLTARCFLPCYAMFMLLAALLFDLIYRDTADKTKAS